MKPKTLLPEKWAKEADVVIVGYGAAGVATAITAHDAGARVLILEKAPKGRREGIAEWQAKVGAPQRQSIVK